MIALILCIAAGIWLGFVLIALTVMAAIKIHDRVVVVVKRNRRFGVPWWHGIVWSEN